MEANVVFGFKSFEENGQIEPFGKDSLYVRYNNFTDYLKFVSSLLEKGIAQIGNQKYHYNPSDIFIVNAELLKPIDFAGIELVKWMRIKYRLLNRIIVLGYTPFGYLMNIKPTNTILFGKGIVYRRLPFPLNQVENNARKITPIKNEDELVKDYADLIKADFSIEGLEHSFANKYGIRLMGKAFEECTQEHFSISSSLANDNKLLISKANFIYRDSFEEAIFNKEKINNDEFTGSLNLFRDLMTKNNSILHIDDEGDSENWYAFVQKLGNIKEANYKTISRSILTKDGQINTTGILDKIKEQKPTVLLIDLRLLGNKEAEESIESISGVKLIKSIREINPWLPIVVISATSKLRSLELLTKHPYNISALWSKPRVDSGKINIFEKLNDLLEKVNAAICQYTIQTEKHNVVTDFHLKKEQNNSPTPPEFHEASQYYLDTNCLFSQKEISTKIHLALQKICTYKSETNETTSPKIVVLRDVVSELQLLAFIKCKTVKEKIYTHGKGIETKYREEYPEESRSRLLAASYGLERLKKLHQEPNNKITDYQDYVDYALGNSIEYKISEDNKKVNLTFTKTVNYAKDENDANTKKVELESSKAKTIIHADDVFRVVIAKKLNSSHFEGKVRLITNDKGLQELMISDLNDQGYTIQGEANKENANILCIKDSRVRCEVLGINNFLKLVLTNDDYVATWY